MTRQTFLPAKGLLSARTFPLTSDLKLDPFERFHEARGFDEWQENRSWTPGRATAQVGKFMKSLPVQPPTRSQLQIRRG